MQDEQKSQSHSDGLEHHVSIQEPSAEVMKEIAQSHDEFDESYPPSGITCSNCGKEEAHYECYPCHCCTFCKKCAMKVATGGKCKKCHNMFSSIVQIHGVPLTSAGGGEVTMMEGVKTEN
jgi:hypothetical protein